MPYVWNFDIRNTVPDYRQAWDSPQVELYYDHVNAMCFLLDGIPYSVVYGPARVFAQALLDKLMFCPAGADRVFKTSSTSGLAGVLRQQLGTIIGTAGTDTFHMRNLYERHAASAAEVAVRDATYAIKDYDSAHDRLLCMPFVHIQRGQSPHIPNAEMTAHINQMGNYTLVDIYTKSPRYFGALHAAVVHGSQIGALGLAGEFVFPGTYNNRRCSGVATNPCVQNNGTWCNVDLGGNCTSGTLSISLDDFAGDRA